MEQFRAGVPPAMSDEKAVPGCVCVCEDCVTVKGETCKVCMKGVCESERVMSRGVCECGSLRKEKHKGQKQSAQGIAECAAPSCR